MAPLEAARACIGARFRLHGRTPEAGLDCVGLVAHAYGLADVPAGYALRGGRAAEIVAAIAAAGFRRCAGDAAEAPGDLLLCETGPFQLHLAIRTDRGIVHADAGLRRVVERPGPPPWRCLARWRAPLTKG